MDLMDRKELYNQIRLYLNRHSLGETTVWTTLNIGEIASIIANVPTVGAESLIYCKDCQMHDNCTFEEFFNLNGIENPFCCVGEHRSDEQHDSANKGTIVGAQVIPPMDFVTFAEQKKRMCDAIECENCGFSISMDCDEWAFNNPRQAQEIVEKWIQENHTKTRKSVFLNLNKNAKVDYNGTPTACVEDIFGISMNCTDCDLTCDICWELPEPIEE